MYLPFLIINNLLVININNTEAFKEVAALGVFLGIGNPNGKLLMVGKEAAIDSEKHPDQ